MSIEDNTPVVEDGEQSLDDFATEFFGQKAEQPEQASSEESEEDAPLEDDANTEDTTTEDDALAENEDENREDAGEGDDEPEAKPKKNRFQERIDELTAGRREAERKLQEAMERLTALENKAEPQTTKTNTPSQKGVTQDGTPSPNDQNEDGTDKYPLGEFDPKFAADVVRHTLQVERDIMNEQLRQEAEQKAMDEQQAALQSSWNDKLNPAKERYPDFTKKGELLTETFENIDQAYATYLTSTLMSMDYGPDVLYYLANNLDEAQKIVQSGPTKATITLGRLESKFADADDTKQKARPKVSNAPNPPAHQNKGSATARASIAPDTDDLDAFTKEFYKR
jgi:hypothetical protein